jgi:polyhydroxybutyrate depolymerase
VALDPSGEPDRPDGATGGDAASPADAIDLDAASPALPDAASPSCGTPALSPGDDLVVGLSVAGVAREYNVHVGDTVDPSAPAPLVLNFHGMNNTPALQESFSRMKGVADDHGFVVVYPKGLDNSFNAGGCCGASASNDVDDLGFSRAIVTDVSARMCIDARRVYATGFSNGGYMSHLLGCRASDVFAAVAPVAAGMGISDCAPDRPVPVIAFHGTSDSVVSHATGAAAVAGWRQRNGCSNTPERESVGSSYCDRWRECDDAVEVQMCSIAGWNHLWPNGFTSIPASPRIWEFLSAHQLPEPGGL